MKLADELAARLRAERARANLTLREAGDRAGLHFGSIHRYEQGRKLPALESLYLLAEAYGVDVAALLPPLSAVGGKRKGK